MLRQLLQITVTYIPAGFKQRVIYIFNQLKQVLG